jgi:N-dimethylarginine dimethylaminohydrolase
VYFLSVSIELSEENMGSAAKTILMCRPTHFRVNYKINPWMKPGKVDQEKAMKQWEKLKATIEKAGAEVKVMEPDGAEQYPDLVFTANAAVVRDKKAYVANFFYPERQGEKYFYTKWFKENGYETVGSHDIPFEGAGDALWIGKDKSKLICGVGPRTDVRALDHVSKVLPDERNPFKVYGYRLVDPRFYHIDTCFCPLDEEIAMYYPYAFDSISQHNLKNDVRQLVPVDEEDATKFACNAIVVGKTVIMHEGSEKTAKALEKVGYHAEFVQMSEFIKSGGSAKCCSLLLN